MSVLLAELRPVSKEECARLPAMVADCHAPTPGDAKAEQRASRLKALAHLGIAAVLWVLVLAAVGAAVEVVGAAASVMAISWRLWP